MPDLSNTPIVPYRNQGSSFSMLDTIHIVGMPSEGTVGQLGVPAPVQ